MKIKVMNRADAEKYTHEQRLEPFYVLSIRSHRSDKPNFDLHNPMIKDILYMVFDDTDNPYDPYAMSDEDGYVILHWVSNLPDDATLIVHCRAGVSRSSAVAAALSYIYNNKDDSEFWHYPPYIPNTHVYFTLRKCYSREEIWNEIIAKDDENRKQYVEFKISQSDW